MHIPLTGIWKLRQPKGQKTMRLTYRQLVLIIYDLTPFQVVSNQFQFHWQHKKATKWRANVCLEHCCAPLLLNFSNGLREMNV